MQVCVTGANGFLGSHIVAQCLDKGYKVIGTVRNTQDSDKTQPLLNLPGASGRLKLVSVKLLPQHSYGLREAVTGCDAVIHTAAPGTRKSMTKADVHTYVFGTLALLRACKAAKVNVVVMTSAMCAVTCCGAGAPASSKASVYSETEWTDPKEQLEKGGLYCASKTLAETAAWKCVKQEAPGFRFVSLLPSCIVGPSISSDLGIVTNNYVLTLLKGDGVADDVLPNSYLSFVDVRDCARHHIAAMERKGTSGRYFSTAPAWHWNDLYELMKKINPKLTSKRPSPEKVLSCFDLTKQNTLGVDVNHVPKIFYDTITYLKSCGVEAATAMETNWDPNVATELRQAATSEPTREADPETRTSMRSVRAETFGYPGKYSFSPKVHVYDGLQSMKHLGNGPPQTLNVSRVATFRDSYIGGLVTESIQGVRSAPETWVLMRGPDEEVKNGATQFAKIVEAQQDNLV